MTRAAPLAISILLGLFLALAPAKAQVLEVYKDISTVLVSEGDVAFEAFDFPLAVQKYEQAIVANPANIWAYIGLGTVYLQIESIQTSIKYYDQALVQDPTHLRALELQAYAYLSEESLDKAQQNLEKMQTICFDRECDEEERLREAVQNHIKEFDLESENS